MKAAVYYGPRDIRVEDVSEPKLEPYGIIIQVKACGVCGSDLHPYTSREATPQIEAGLTIGHEFAGDVVSVGPNAVGIKKGDRVHAAPLTACGKCEWCQKYLPERCSNVQTIGIFVNGGFAERVSIPMAMAYRTVFPLPENMSYEVGATLEPLSVALYGVHRAEPAPGDTVVIQGAGPIGLCALQSFKAMGLSKIIVIGGKRNKRLALAKAMGADIVISAEEEDPVKRVYEATSGKGADIVAETAGAPPTMRRAIDMACFKGKIIVYTLSAWPDPKWTVDDIFLKQLTLIGTQGGGALEPLELVQAGKVNTKSLITHEFPLDRIKEAFETALTNDEAVKVMVKL